MSDAYKELYHAQVSEHENTFRRLRALERENDNLRRMALQWQREYADAVKLIHGVADKLLKINRPTGDGSNVK
jgi:hypothetical protein